MLLETKTMTEEIVELLGRLKLLHIKYKSGEFETFRSQYEFEVFYWYQFKRLATLISEQIHIIKPFQNKNNQ